MTMPVPPVPPDPDKERDRSVAKQVAIVALIGVLLSSVASFLTGYLTARVTANSSHQTTQYQAQSQANEALREFLRAQKKSAYANYLIDANNAANNAIDLEVRDATSTLDLKPRHLAALHNRDEAALTKLSADSQVILLLSPGKSNGPGELALLSGNLVTLLNDLDNKASDLLTSLAAHRITRASYEERKAALIQEYNQWPDIAGHFGILARADLLGH